MQEFLLQYENCLFTSILYHNDRWISLPLHSKRLQLKPAEYNELKIILDEYYKKLQPTQSESLKCVVVKTGGLGSFCVKQEFNLPKAIKVAVVQAKREFTVKTTAWVRERHQLDALKARLNVGEIVTYQENLLYEGLITNFIVVMKNSDGLFYLQTAPLDAVVVGTCLQSLIAVCLISGIDVVYSHPDLHNIKQWKGAFLTNAFRYNCH
jgi:Amino-transferase class IV